MIHPIAPTMELIVQEDRQRPTVRIRGEVDICTAPRLLGELLEVCARTQDCLVVDLTETTFLDCRGLAALATVHDALRSRGRSLALRGAHGGLRKVLGMVSLGDLLDEAPTALR